MKFYSYIFIIFLLISRASAQDVAFTLGVSKANISAGEQIQATFSINASGKNFQAPSFKDFHVLAGPSQSTSMQFINGNMSQSISFTYVIQAKSEGTFKLGPALIEANGKVIKSNIVSITVSKGSASAGTNSGAGEDINTQIGKNLFIKAIVNKVNVLQGESVRVTYKLFARIDLVNMNLTKMPTLNGFWSQDAGSPKKLELKSEVIDGVQYNTAEIKKTVLFPQREGHLVIDPMEAETVVRVRSKRKSRGYDPFEDFFNDPFFGGNYQDVNYTVKSEPVKITVKPLPPHAPPGFSGAVGEYAMESFIDKPETKMNEPVTLKIKISGTGNLKLIDPIKLELPQDIESYDPKINDNISSGPSGVSGSRTFEYLLIPRHVGEYKINPFEFSYYNLQKNKYISLRAPEFLIKVLRGAGGENVSTNFSGVNKEDVQFLGKDIRYIKTGKINVRPRGAFLFGSPTYYILLASPFCFMIAFLIYRRKNEQQSQNINLVKSRRATKIAKKRLAMAQKYIKEGNKAMVYEEVLKAMWGYVSDKFNLPVSDLSKQSIEQVLTSRNKDKHLISEFLEIIDQCEYARYAPAGGISEIENIYKKSVDIITALEQG